MSDDDPAPAPTSARRRMHAAQPRRRRLNVRFNDEELAVLECRAAAFGMATATYVAEAALAGARDPDQLPLEIGLVDERARLLRALLVLHGELLRARRDGHETAVEDVADRIDDMLLDLTRHLRDPRD